MYICIEEVFYKKQSKKMTMKTQKVNERYLKLLEELKTIDKITNLRKIITKHSITAGASLALRTHFLEFNALEGYWTLKPEADINIEAANFLRTTIKDRAKKLEQERKAKLDLPIEEKKPSITEEDAIHVLLAAKGKTKYRIIKIIEEEVKL